MDSKMQMRNTGIAIDWMADHEMHEQARLRLQPDISEKGRRRKEGRA